MYAEETLRQDVITFRQAIEAKAPVLAGGKGLYDLLLGSIEDKLKNKHVLYIVGDGPLRLLPFEALPTSAGETGQFVLNSRPYDIVYAHSAAVLSELRESRREAAISRSAEQPPASRRQLLLFANPAYRPPSLVDVFRDSTGCQNLKLTDIKGTAEEAAALLDVFKLGANDIGINLGVSAQPRQLRQLPIDRFRFVHLAMHGVLCQGEGQNGWTEAALAFSPEGDGTSSLLRLEDVYSLRFDADLIALSACQTALGQEIHGEGVLGLTRAFLFSGTDTVVSTLWSVDDRATAHLMSTVYHDLSSQEWRNMRRGRSTLIALQSAKRRLATERPNEGRDTEGPWRHPFYWAPFVIYGLPGSS